MSLLSLPPSPVRLRPTPRLQEEELRDSILLVFANKQDQKGALNASQVKTKSGAARVAAVVLELSL